MNYNLTTQLAAERQAALVQLKAARVARKTSTTKTSQPTRTRRLFLGRLAAA